jgi:hypothetical protein
MVVHCFPAFIKWGAYLSERNLESQRFYIYREIMEGLENSGQAFDPVHTPGEAKPGDVLVRQRNIRIVASIEQPTGVEGVLLNLAESTSASDTPVDQIHHESDIGPRLIQARYPEPGSSIREQVPGLKRSAELAFQPASAESLYILGQRLCSIRISCGYLVIGWPDQLSFNQFLSYQAFFWLILWYPTIGQGLHEFHQSGFVLATQPQVAQFLFINRLWILRRLPTCGINITSIVEVYDILQLFEKTVVTVRFGKLDITQGHHFELAILFRINNDGAQAKIHGCIL